MKERWQYVFTAVADNSEALQITLITTLIVLIVASCLYKRRRLEKSAMNTFQNNGLR